MDHAGDFWNVGTLCVLVACALKTFNAPLDLYPTKPVSSERLN
jgi:hypothetical protein